MLQSVHRWYHCSVRSCLSANGSQISGPIVFLGLLEASAFKSHPNLSQAFEPWTENLSFLLLPLNIFSDILQLSLEGNLLKLLILLFSYDPLHRTLMTHQKQTLRFCKFLVFLEKNEGLAIKNFPLGEDKYFILACCITISQSFWTKQP